MFIYLQGHQGHQIT